MPQSLLVSFPSIKSLTDMIFTSSPQPFWHEGLISWNTIFPWPGGRAVGDRRQSSGGIASEASPAHPLLTSCGMAHFLTGHRPPTSPLPRGWRHLLYPMNHYFILSVHLLKNVLLHVIFVPFETISTRIHLLFVNSFTHCLPYLTYIP